MKHPVKLGQFEISIFSARLIWAFVIIFITLAWALCSSSVTAIWVVLAIALLFVLFALGVIIVGSFVLIRAGISTLFPSKVEQVRGSVCKAPGSRCLSFVKFFYSPKTVKLTFQPIVDDWQYEIFEALKKKRIWKARWVSMRYRWAFLKAMGLSKTWKAFEKVVGLVKKG